MISNVTGTWLTPEQATSPGYWVEQFRVSVRFAACLDTAAADTDLLVVEVGPGRSVSRIVREHLGPRAMVVSPMRHPHGDTSDAYCLAEGLAQLWRHGAAVDWRQVHGPLPRRKLALPGYPFDRRRYWVEPAVRTAPAGKAPATVADAPEEPAADAQFIGSSAQRPTLMVEYVAPRTEEERELAAIWCEVLGFDRVGVHDSFFDLGGDSLVAVQLLTRLARISPVRLSMDQLYYHPTVAELAELFAGSSRQL